MQQEKQKELAISLLGAVCDHKRREKVLDVLEHNHALFSLGMLGKGTANSRILNYLGLGETEKMVFFSIMPSRIARETLNAMNERLALDTPGHGIAFMARIHEGCYHVPVRFTGDESGGEAVEQTTMHDMILVVVNRGYTEEVMDVARTAGATGGTVLHARGCGLAGAEKFFGVTIQPERELILIVARVEDSCGIMSAIAEDMGPGSAAGAISFSMPLTDVKGLGGEPIPKEVKK